jgi:hypothetical protein
MVGRYREKFIKEAKNIAKLKHTNIVKVIEVFEENETAYYVMEYIEGCSLQEVRDKGALPEKEALGYIRQVASALDYIHGLQMNHLDVKPSNILRKINSDDVVLIDFGMSKQYDASGSQTSSTPVGVSAGYAPIELSTQNGVSQFSAPTDIYSLGATLYKLLTGNTPPDATTIINDGLPALPSHISPATSAAITAAMTPAKRNRPQSIRRFLNLLDNEIEVVIEEPETKPEPKPEPKPNNIPKKKKRYLNPLWIGLGVVVAILLFVIYLLLPSPLKYDMVSDFSEGLARVYVYSNGQYKYGFIDKSGHEVVPLKYDKAGDFSEGLAAVVLNGKWGYIDKSGREVIPLKYNERERYWPDYWADNFSEDLVAVELNGKWSYIDKSGNEMIPLKYDKAGNFSEGLTAVRLKGKWGYIDKSGREVIPLKYNGAGKFSEGMAAVELNGKWGYIDKNGIVETPLKYDKAGDFSEGMAAVELNGEWGYIDNSIHEVTPLKYNKAGDFSEGLAAVELNGKWGYIDKSGLEVVPLKYDRAGDFSEGLAAVKLNEKWGYIEKSGKEVIPLKYDRAGNFSEGLAVVEFKKLTMLGWGRYYMHIDKSGKEINVRLNEQEFGINTRGEEMPPLDNGKDSITGNVETTEPIRKEGKVDTVIPLKYDDVWSFTEGLAAVKVKNKYGYINKSGKVIIPLKYDMVWPFSKGLARVGLNEKWGFIDKNGNLIYDYALPFSEGLAEVKLNGQILYIDKQGREYKTMG